LDQTAKELGYKTVGEQTIVHLLFGGARTKPQNHQACRIYLEHSNGLYKCNFIAFRQEVICHCTPKSSRGRMCLEKVKYNCPITKKEMNLSQY